MTLAFLSVENYNAINGWGTAQSPSCSLRRTEAEVTSNRCYIYPQAPLSLALCPIQLCIQPRVEEVSHIHPTQVGALRQAGPSLQCLDAELRAELQEWGGLSRSPAYQAVVPGILSRQPAPTEGTPGLIPRRFDSGWYECGFPLRSSLNRPLYL